MSTAAPSRLPLPASRSTGDWLGVQPAAWAKAAVIAAAFVAIYRFNLTRLWAKTNLFSGDPNWSHSSLVPVIGLYYLLLQREALAATPRRPMLGGRPSAGRFVAAAALAVGGAVLGFGLSKLVPEQEGLWIVRGLLENGGYGLIGFGVMVALFDWGLACLFGGLLLSAYGIWPGRNDFVNDAGMILTLFGIVLTLCGPAVMRIAWFPIAFLVCALPWPDLVYSQVTAPLQTASARVAVGVLQMVGMDASYGGTKIFIPQFAASGMRLPDRALNVAEACAGLRSLMTFITLGAMVAFLSSRRLWQKIVITLSAIPIAISCNMMRVAGQGIIDTYIGREWSEGFAHQFAGMVMLIPAFFLIWGVSFVVDRLFIEEADAKPQKPAAAGISPGTPPASAGGLV